ncbi:hypothetical protein FQN54_009002 [Arachnomyces sp. PD_36]|nr:hypothetical protein FQN54_009002 [Arachnomyces sp. PD_36]
MTETAHASAEHSAPTPIPSRPAARKGNNTKHNTSDEKKNLSNSQAVPLPTPKLRLRANDLTHPSTKTFLTLFPDLNSTTQDALAVIVAELYTSPPEPPNGPPSPTPAPYFTPSLPPTRSVTYYLNDFSGVAYTTSIELDKDHKEIHLSLSYISSVSSRNTPAATKTELTGVLTHELVHCFQHSTPPRTPERPNPPSPPSGLIEGVADFVRLKAGLSPPHWKRPLSAADRPEKWDAGYQHTAYFLEWIEDVRVGKGAVGMLNDRLGREGYDGEFWVALFGESVETLWEEYGVYLDGGLNAKKGGGKK